MTQLYGLVDVFMLINRKFPTDTIRGKQMSVGRNIQGRWINIETVSQTLIISDRSDDKPLSEPMMT